MVDEANVLGGFLMPEEMAGPLIEKLERQGYIEVSPEYKKRVNDRINAIAKQGAADKGIADKVGQYLAAVGWDDKYFIRYDDLTTPMLHDIIVLAESGSLVVVDNTAE